MGERGLARRHDSSSSAPSTFIAPVARWQTAEGTVERGAEPSRSAADAAAAAAKAAAAANTCLAFIRHILYHTPPPPAARTGAVSPGGRGQGENVV